MSDVESDCDDVFTDDSKGYPCSDDAKGSNSTDDGNSYLVTRKKRRGIIEKRRRDRINNSLSELRRLVPAAFEKQGSAKLEKAEILQMTVDHLRIMHSKGLELLPFDPHGLALDYHGIGFRECVSEVARYLAAFEGLDLQDPLRLRLVSHLQCCSSTRTPPPTPWFAVPAPQYPSTSTSVNLSSDRRPSSNSSAMSLDSGGSSSPTTRQSSTSLSPLIKPVFRRSFTLGSEGSRVQRSPVTPYRPWGAEVAY